MSSEPLDAEPPTAEHSGLGSSAHTGVADISMLRARRRAARRRAARRRRSLARLDVAIGVVAAIVLLAASPGLAITAAIALGVLAACLASIAAGRLLRAWRER